MIQFSLISTRTISIGLLISSDQASIDHKDCQLLSHTCYFLVIQGTLDVKKEVPQQQILKTFEFCRGLFSSTWQPETRASVLKKIEEAEEHDRAFGPSADGKTAMEKLKLNLSEEEMGVIKYIENRKAMRLDDTLTINSFVSDAVDDRRLRLERGKLGLMAIAAGGDNVPMTA